MLCDYQTSDPRNIRFDIFPYSNSKTVSLIPPSSLMWGKISFIAILRSDGRLRRRQKLQLSWSIPLSWSHQTTFVRRHFMNRTVKSLGNSEILTGQAFSKATWSSMHLMKVLLGSWNWESLKPRAVRADLTERFKPTYCPFSCFPWVPSYLNYRLLN